MGRNYTTRDVISNFIIQLFVIHGIFRFQFHTTIETSYGCSENTRSTILRPTQTLPTRPIHVPPNYAVDVIIRELLPSINIPIRKKGNVINLPVTTIRDNRVGREIRSTRVIDEPGDATAVLAVDRVVFPARGVEFVECEQIRRAYFGVDVGAPRGLARADYLSSVFVD